MTESYRFKVMKNILVALWALLFAAFCIAQNDDTKAVSKNASDFSGTWVLDKSKSDMGLDKGPIKLTWKVKPEFPDSTLVIVQTSSEVRVAENGSAESSIYYTDGRPSIVVDAGDTDAPSKAKWKDRKLVNESSISVNGMSIGGRPAQMKKKETWELKSDGRTMVQTISWQAEVGQGPAPMTKVYLKKS